MGRELAITAEHDPGLYDSATGLSLTAEKVVDISDDCSSGERTILLFTRAKRGRIVQVTFPYPDHLYMGSHTHFFVDEPLGGCADGRGDSFTPLAARAGFSASDFAALLKQLAPETAHEA